MIRLVGGLDMSRESWSVRDGLLWMRREIELLIGGTMRRLISEDMGGDVVYYPGLIENDVAFVNSLMGGWHYSDTIHWEGIRWVYPKGEKNRGMAWYGDVDYSYIDYSFPAAPMEGDLLYVAQDLEEALGVTFNGVLCNLYPNGKYTVGWHSDDTDSRKPNSPIAIVSVGTSRTFKLRHKRGLHEDISIVLNDRDVLVMQGATQDNWLHHIPRERSVNGVRISLTYRQMG